MEGEKWMNIRNDHLKGLSYKAIADLKIECIQAYMSLGKQKKAGH